MEIGNLNIAGKEYVVIPREEYARLCAPIRTTKLPPWPVADRHGHREAVPAVLAAMARALIRRRLEAGLAQQELARLAGVRPETISRLESGKYRPQRATMLRVDKALDKRNRKRPAAR